MNDPTVNLVAFTIYWVVVAAIVADILVTATISQLRK